MSKAPTVSVVIPCYNHGRYVRTAIASVEKQTFDDVEIIVVNDGSTEADTLQTFREIEHEGILVVNKSNGGCGSARNAGIKIARGEFIFPLDADDTIEPLYFEKAVAILKEKSDVGIVTCGVHYFGRVTANWIPVGTNLPNLLGLQDIAPGSMYRRQCWEELGGYTELRELFGIDDYDFWLRILAAKWQVEVVPDYLFNYYQHESGVCRTVVNRNLAMHNFFVQRHQDLYKEFVVDVVPTMRTRYEDAMDKFNLYLSAFNSQLEINEQLESRIKSQLEINEQLESRIKSQLEINDHLQSEMKTQFEINGRLESKIKALRRWNPIWPLFRALPETLRKSIMRMAGV